MKERPYEVYSQVATIERSQWHQANPQNDPNESNQNQWLLQTIESTITSHCEDKRDLYCKKDLRTAGLAFPENKLHVLLRETSVKLVIQYGDTPVSAFLQLISSKHCIFTNHYAITSMPQPLVMTYARECLSLPWILTNKGIKQLVGTWWLLQWLGPAKTLCIAVDNEG